MRGCRKGGIASIGAPLLTCTTLVSLIFPSPARAFMISRPPFILTTIKTTVAADFLHDVQNCPNIGKARPHRTCLCANQNDEAPSKDKNTIDTNSKLSIPASFMKAEAAKMRKDADRMETTLTLEMIDTLEKQLIEVMSAAKQTEGAGVSNERIARKREDIRRQIEILARRTNNASGLLGSLPSTTADKSRSSAENNRLTNPSSSIISAVNNTNSDNQQFPSRPSLPSEELQIAIQFYESLPIQTQHILLEAMRYESKEDDEGNPQSFTSKKIVLKLYEQSDVLLNQPSIFWKTLVSPPAKNDETQPRKMTRSDSTQEGDDREEQKLFNLSDLADLSTFVEDSQLERFVESYFPQRTRKIGQSPSIDDATDFLNDILDRDTFNPTSKPERIPGGFVIRGQNRVKDGNGQTMIDVIDETFSKSALKGKLQFFFVRDPTPDAIEDMEGELWGQAVLVLLSNDLSPDRNKLLNLFLSTTSVGLIFLFAVGVFSDNEAVMHRLQDANAIDNFDTSWLNELMLPLFVSIVGTQVAHEGAHVFVAWREKFKTMVPTFLPAVFLPFFGAATQLKTPPKNLRALFDFALAGPAAGIIVSLGLLLGGLQLTQSLDSTSLTYFPNLKVDFLRASSLGGGIVDGVLGGDIFALGDESTTALSLHPFTIAGFVGLMVNALALLPIGSTDGGRLATALFGRNGHILIQGLTFLVLFGAGIFGADKANILLAYGLFTFFTQREMEIPCRNEIDDVDFPRAILAVAAWVLVILILVPVQ